VHGGTSEQPPSPILLTTTLLSISLSLTLSFKPLSLFYLTFPLSLLDSLMGSPGKMEFMQT